MLAASEVEGTMPKVVLLIAASTLFFWSLDVWAGHARTDNPERDATFVICNAL
jgi:hypothetical protein